MKSTHFKNLLALSLVLTFAAVGCKKNPYGVTNIPNAPIANVNDGSTAPPISPEFPATTGTNFGSTDPNFAGIPMGPGHQGWAKDSTTFASDTVYFGYDSSVVPTSEKSKVANVAEYLKSNPASAVEVEGHCDERGTEEYNRSLGERRALAIREELARLGIDPNRLDTVSFGEDRPANPGHDEAAWRQNRRGEFILLSPPK